MMVDEIYEQPLQKIAPIYKTLHSLVLKKKLVKHLGLPCVIVLSET